MQPSASSTAVGQLRVSLSPRDIPPLATSLVDVVRIASDPDVSFDKLERMIARDQALTLRVLAVANSSYYGCSRRIESARTALALLGTRQVQNIASAMALAPAFDSEHGPRLWSHGLSTALWTGHVIRALGLPPLDYVFTAGLLHDLGVVLLLRSAPEQEREFISEAQLGERELEEIEREHLGTDHAQLGGRATLAWKLPERIGTLVASHHDTSITPAQCLDLAVLRVADILASLAAGEAGDGIRATEAALGVLSGLGLGQSDFQRLLDRADEVDAEAAAFE